MILVIKHIDIEGPGSMEDFFRNTAWRLKMVDLSVADLLPVELDEVEAVVSLGGPMNAYEEDKYPFLKDEDAFLKKALKSEVPILGICLGSQLLAKAAGAKVLKAKEKEIGWHRVNLTEDGRTDDLFSGLAKELDVFQWHEDTFEIPKGGVRLAESDICPNQAFRFGKNAYGLQFHIEVTPEMISAWIKKYAGAQPDTKDMLIEAYKINARFKKQAGLVYLNFARIIRADKNKYSDVR